MNGVTMFYHVLPCFLQLSLKRIVRNEPNLDGFQHIYRRSDAENFGSVCLMVREKIERQTDRQTDGRTDRHGDNISVFFLMKKALKMHILSCGKSDLVQTTLKYDPFHQKIPPDNQE